jgi:hypothetical protein
MDKLIHVDGSDPSIEFICEIKDHEIAEEDMSEALYKIDPNILANNIFNNKDRLFEFHKKKLLIALNTYLHPKGEVDLIYQKFKQNKKYDQVWTPSVKINPKPKELETAGYWFRYCWDEDGDIVVVQRETLVSFMPDGAYVLRQDNFYTGEDQFELGEKIMVPKLKNLNNDDYVSMLINNFNILDNYTRINENKIVSKAKYDCKRKSRIK